MVDQALLPQFRKINLSKDSLKTKDRIREFWRAANKETRAEMLAYADITKFAVDQAMKVGRITARLATAMAEYLGANPYYLTAVQDEPVKGSDEVLYAFLVEQGYESLLKQKKTGKAKGRPPKKSNEKKPAAADTVITAPKAAETAALMKTPDVAEADEADETEVAFVDFVGDLLDTMPADLRKSLDNMSEDDVVMLLRGLCLRAKFNDDARYVMDMIKMLLID